MLKPTILNIITTAFIQNTRHTLNIIKIQIHLFKKKNSIKLRTNYVTYNWKRVQRRGLHLFWHTHMI